MRKILIATTGLIFLVVAANIQPAAFLRGSNLGIFEDRIEGPMDVMMRYSPELRANFEDFKKCERRPVCDSKPIFSERDRIVATIWPHVSDRLTVRHDWGTCGSCRVAQDAFEKAQVTVGVIRLQYACVPDAIYTWHTSNNSGMEDGYDSGGYKCYGKNISYPS